MATYTKEEREANQELWLEALRSGKYKQATGALRHLTKDEEKFCCLGVACEISGLDDWIDDCYLGEDSHLPFEVVSWLGMISCDGSILDENNAVEKSSLVQLNDEAGYNFDQIAEFITDHREELFA